MTMVIVLLQTGIYFDFMVFFCTSKFFFLMSKWKIYFLKKLNRENIGFYFVIKYYAISYYSFFIPITLMSEKELPEIKDKVK